MLNSQYGWPLRVTSPIHAATCGPIGMLGDQQCLRPEPRPMPGRPPSSRLRFVGNLVAEIGQSLAHGVVVEGGGKRVEDGLRRSFRCEQRVPGRHRRAGRRYVGDPGSETNK
jgi:hypothetical protein